MIQSATWQPINISPFCMMFVETTYDDSEGTDYVKTLRPVKMLQAFILRCSKPRFYSKLVLLMLKYSDPVFSPYFRSYQHHQTNWNHILNLNKWPMHKGEQQFVDLFYQQSHSGQSEQAALSPLNKPLILISCYGSDSLLGRNKHHLGGHLHLMHLEAVWLSVLCLRGL